MKKIISMLGVAAMLCTVMSVSAFADESLDTTYEGEDTAYEDMYDTELIDEGGEFVDDDAAPSDEDIGYDGDAAPSDEDITGDETATEGEATTGELTDADKASPDTGVEGVAGVAGIAILAAGTVLLAGGKRSTKK